MRTCSFSWNGASFRPSVTDWPLVLVACLLLTVCAGWSAEQAFTDSVTQVNASFHWDHTVANVPQPAITPPPRVPLAQQPNNLTTLNFNAGDPSLYRVQNINGSLYNCVLVSTFTQKNAFWQAALPDQDLHLHSDSGGYDIFTWVTAGSDLKDYFSTNYAATLTTGNVDRRVSQTLGMEDRTGQNRVLAFYWAPLELVLRPAYSADISTQINYSGLGTYGDGSFAVNDAAAGGPAFLFQDNSYTTFSGAEGFGDFTMNNEAKTVPGNPNAMPWTAMGYTYNWNSLEDGQGGRALDPLRVGSYVGASEFVVSAGSWVKFDHFEENLYAYLVPEPDSAVLLLFAAGGVFVFRRLRLARSVQ